MGVLVHSTGGATEPGSALELVVASQVCSTCNASCFPYAAETSLLFLELTLFLSTPANFLMFPLLRIYCRPRHDAVLAGLANGVLVADLRRRLF